RDVASAILRFALRSVSYSAKVQICTLEQYQQVTAVTAPAYATGTGRVLALLLLSPDHHMFHRVQRA
ncbi:TPA: hypothetical protein ACWXSR_005438, partial [Escherichia coli]